MNVTFRARHANKKRSALMRHLSIFKLHSVFSVTASARDIAVASAAANEGVEEKRRKLIGSSFSGGLGPMHGELFASL